MRRARALQNALFAVRRAVRATAGFAVCGAFLLLLWHGWFPDIRQPGADMARIAAAAVLTAVLAVRIASRLRTSERRRSPRREALSDAELGLLLLTATYVLLAVSGGVDSPVYPLVYAVVSFLVTFHRLVVGLPLAAAAIGFEIVLAFSPAAPPGAARSFPGHAGFIAIFALLNVAFLYAEVARQRREHRQRLAAELESMKQEAREFRLISTALGADSRVRSRAEEEDKISQGSIETIHQQLYSTIELLKNAMELQTCALLWLDEAGDHLKIKELCTDASNLAEDPLSAHSGALGAVLKSSRPYVAEWPKMAMLPYYSGPAVVAAVAGVPVLEGAIPRGVLVADRQHPRAFTPADVDVLRGAASQIVRVVQSERVFQAVERSKHEHERFYRASAELNRALTLDQVYDAAISGARGAAEFDFAAIASFDGRRGTHTILRAEGESIEGLADSVHQDGSSIAAMVAKNKLALPAGGEWREQNVPIYSSHENIGRYESLLVLPLIVKDEVVGTMAVAARRPGAFPGDRREMLGVIANHVAISLQNARMVRALEEQATTDGLTGLVNHRTFQERFSAMLDRARRHRFPVSLILTDIDHFKKVNDTHGHPTGDEVLRRVAGVMNGRARKIDIVARYGGEEFAIVLESTDRAGAKQLAERIRTEVMQQTFRSQKGVSFQATMSLGIASFPEDAAEKTEIIAEADKALYFAKHNGRNRAVCWSEMKDVRVTKPEKTADKAEKAA